MPVVSDWFIFIIIHNLTTNYHPCSSQVNDSDRTDGQTDIQTHGRHFIAPLPKHWWGAENDGYDNIFNNCFIELKTIFLAKTLNLTLE